MRFSKYSAVVLATLAASGAPAISQDMVDETYTGAKLANLPGTTFPTRSPVVEGTTLQFLAPGVTSKEVLMRLPVIPEGDVATGSSVGVIFDLNFTRLTRDNDLVVLLGDGDRLVGASLRDNDNGKSGAVAHNDPPSPDIPPIEGALLFDNSGFAPIGESSVRTTRICISSTGTHVEQAYRDKSGSADFDTILSGAGKLSLVLFSGSTNEEYQINSVRFRVFKNQVCSAGPVTVTVTVDIKPGDSSNSINPRSRGRIPVAILTTVDFDASWVDATTVRFGSTGTEAAPSHSALEDVDGDGDDDMILHFATQNTNIECSTSLGSLTGQTAAMLRIVGSDSISTKGCK